MAMAIDVRYTVVSDSTGMTATDAPNGATTATEVAPDATDVAADGTDVGDASQRTASRPGPPAPRRSRPARAQRRWGAGFDPDRLALLELRMWQAYYRHQPVRLFGLLVRTLREQANASLPRAALAAAWLTRAAVGFARANGDYERFAPDIARGYRALGMPRHVDVEAVARHELDWWIVRREMGLAAGEAAGEEISRLYAAMYDLPIAEVAEAGRLRGLAAEVRDRGASDDPNGPAGQGDAYWPVVARLLRESYRNLRAALES
jgi:hypothetical protein